MKYVVFLALLTLSPTSQALANGGDGPAYKSHLPASPWNYATSNNAATTTTIDGYLVYFDQINATKTIVIEFPNGSTAVEIPVSTMTKIYQQMIARPAATTALPTVKVSDACRSSEEQNGNNDHNNIEPAQTVKAAAEPTTAQHAPYRRRYDPCRGEEQGDFGDDDRGYETPVRQAASKPAATPPITPKPSRGCDGPEEENWQEREERRPR